MAWFADLEECRYFPGDTSKLKAVGWLEKGRPFATGEVPEGFVERFSALVRVAWAPWDLMGSHECDLCSRSSACGAANLWLPAGNVVFVAPELLAHYVTEHHYRPPDGFIEAVAATDSVDQAAVERHYVVPTSPTR